MGVVLRFTEEQLAAHNRRRANERAVAEATSNRQAKAVGARLEHWLRDNPHATPEQISRATKDFLRATRGNTRGG